MEETLKKIKQIILNTDSDMDRLPSKWDKLRIEAYESIREVFGYNDHIPFQGEKDA